MISSVILWLISNLSILCLLVGIGELATSSTIGVPGMLLLIELLLLTTLRFLFYLESLRLLPRILNSEY